MTNSSVSQNGRVCVQTSGMAVPDLQPHPVIDLADKAIAVWPENAERFRKAADLVASGEVEVFEMTWKAGASYDPVGRIWSQTRNGRFYILRRRYLENELAAPKIQERWIVTCDCEDYQRNHAPIRNGQRFCKHVAAYRMAVKLAEIRESSLTNEERQRTWQARRDAKRRWQRAQMDRRNAEYNASTQGARRYIQMAYANGQRTFAEGTTAGEKFHQVQAAETAAKAETDALLDRLNEELYG